VRDMRRLWLRSMVIVGAAKSSWWGGWGLRVKNALLLSRLSVFIEVMTDACQSLRYMTQKVTMGELWQH